MSWTISIFHATRWFELANIEVCLNDIYCVSSICDSAWSEGNLVNYLENHNGYHEGENNNNYNTDKQTNKQTKTDRQTNKTQTLTRIMVMIAKSRQKSTIPIPLGKTLFCIVFHLRTSKVLYFLKIKQRRKCLWILQRPKSILRLAC